MYSRVDAKQDLQDVVWAEDKIVPIVEGPYRHRVMVYCSSQGRQKAQFANGELPYFAYVENTNSKGQWVARGNNIVPVLPDGRILMVVEQRPIVALFPGHPTKVEFENGKTFDLGKFGSPEFPGGGVEPGEGLTMGGMRELSEEAGIKDQKALVYTRAHSVYAFGSDIAGANYYCVAYLTGVALHDSVEDEGGVLNVLALTENEVERNIRNGVIASGQAALLSWPFYKEVVIARNYKSFLEEWVKTGYLKVEEVQIKR